MYAYIVEIGKLVDTHERQRRNTDGSPSTEARRIARIARERERV